MRYLPTLNNLVVLILAKNEADVIGSTLDHLLTQYGYPDRVHVVADHCIDATAEIAQARGVNVHIRRHHAESSKGAALRWWVEKTTHEISPDTYIVVLDADSQLNHDFFRSIAHASRSGGLVFQSKIEPRIETNNPISLLTGLSEITEQSFFGRIRSTLGWPIRLRGTGMVFKRTVLDRFHESLSTSIEDAELTIKLGAAGIPIRYIKEAIVFDPKPADKTAAINQRARWLKGQSHLVRSKPKEILKLLSTGLPGWSLLLSVLGKPRSLFLPLKVALLLGSTVLASATTSLNVVWNIIAILLGIDITIQFIALLFALRSLDDRVCAFRALVFLPYFLFLWVHSALLACSSKDPWLRARPLSFEVIVKKSGEAQTETP